MGIHRQALGIGVAGNFTGHLEQAGEAGDFVAVKTADSSAPKGVFPFYVPGAAGALGTYPLDANRIRLGADEDKVQLEPELALLCALEYDAEGRVRRVEPRRFAAYNDCSIRRPGAKKISEKKNWGACTKGISETSVAVDRFGPGGILDHYRIACFLQRDGELTAYGVDSAVRSYSYFYDRLLPWLVDRLRNQRDEGPLEDLAQLVRDADCPQAAVVSVGATRYTLFGEQTFVRRGDEAYVVLYDERQYEPERLPGLLASGERGAAGLSVLHQRVE